MDSPRDSSNSDCGASSSGGGSVSSIARGSEGKSRAKRVKGRWTLHEHRHFLVGLERYGKDWKAIGGLVRTRTVVQIRTHAQKYFLKTEKGRSFPEEPYEATEDDGVTDSSGFASSSSDLESLPASSSNNAAAPPSAIPRRSASVGEAGGKTTLPAPSTARGKRLTCFGSGAGGRGGGPGDGTVGSDEDAVCVMSVPRATRSRAAAIRRAAVVSAPEGDLAVGGAVGDVFADSPEAKRCKMELPSAPPTGVVVRTRMLQVVGGGGGERRTIFAAAAAAQQDSATVTAGSSPSPPLSEGFRGKRLMVAGGAPGTFGSGLQIDTVLPPSATHQESPAMVTPTFSDGSGAGWINPAWSTIEETATATGGGGGLSRIEGWTGDINVFPGGSQKSPFNSNENFLEGLVVDSTKINSYQTTSSSCSSPADTNRYLAANHFLPAAASITPSGIPTSGAEDGIFRYDVDAPINHQQPPTNHQQQGQPGSCSNPGMPSTCGDMPGAETVYDNGADPAYLLKPVFQSVTGCPGAPRWQQFGGVQGGGMCGDLTGLGGGAVVGLDAAFNIVGNPKRYPTCDADNDQATWGGGDNGGFGGYGSSTTGASDFDESGSFGCSVGGVRGAGGGGGGGGCGGGGALVSDPPHTHTPLDLLFSPVGATGVGAPDGWIESRGGGAGMGLGLGLAVSLDGTEAVGDSLGSADSGWLQNQTAVDGHSLDGAEARVMDELFVFEDHFGMM